MGIPCAIMAFVCTLFAPTRRLQPAVCMTAFTFGILVLVAAGVIAGLGAFLGNRDTSTASPFVQAVAQVGSETVVPISDDPDAVLKELPALATRHQELIREHFGRELTFDAAGMAELDSVITAEFDGQPPAYFEPVVMSFGTFAGECIRQNHGGTWAHDDEHGYHLTGVGPMNRTVHPFSKIQERFVYGDGEPLDEYFREVAV